MTGAEQTKMSKHWRMLFAAAANINTADIVHHLKMLCQEYISALHVLKQSSCNARNPPKAPSSAPSQSHLTTQLQHEHCHDVCY
jgi:hypothetical protein